MMSLINKMLSDLEKRDAFLNENQDVVLDGLYSAYDLEPDKKLNRLPSIIVSLTLATLLVAIIILYDVIKINGSFELSRIYSLISNSKFVSNLKDEYETVSIVHEEADELNKNNNIDLSSSIILDVDLKDNDEDVVILLKENKAAKQKYNHFLKLDNNLLLQNTILNEVTAIEVLNRIESIHFETDSNGINMVINMPEEIDYMIYELSNPNRTVVEINNAEIGFKIESLEPVEPIVAIRYSIDKDQRFKLVLESEQPLTIKKSMTNESVNSHDLVVVMEYHWENEIAVSSKDNSLAEIIELQLHTEANTSIKGEIIKTLVDQDTNTYAEKLFQQAYADYKNGNISNSLKLLNKSLDTDASHVNARSTLALILSKQGHLDLAYSVLNEGLIQYPNQINWVRIYARFLMKEGKLVEAKKLLNSQTPDFHSHTNYYALSAAVFQKLNEHKQSAKIYRNLLKINPLNSIWWMGLAISLESMKRYEDALYAYQKASNNSSMVNDLKGFVTERINMLNNLIRDESA